MLGPRVERVKVRLGDIEYFCFLSYFLNMSAIGLPIRLLHEAQGHIVTIELKSGELYRGHLLETEDNMNSHMQNITMTGRDGKISKLEYVYIRGSKVRFMIVPDMLKNSPMFKRFDPKNKDKTPKGLGRGYNGKGPIDARSRVRGRGRAN